MNALFNGRYKAFTVRYGGLTNVLFTDIRISLPYDPKIDAGKIPPPIISCKAIWDTGATNSVITKSLAQKIGLVPTGKSPVANTTSVSLQNNYLVNIILPNKVIIPYVRITECEDVLGVGAQTLIGMDIIGAGDFAVSKESGKTVMSFMLPPFQTIDYVKISNDENVKVAQSEQIIATKEQRKLRQQNKKKIKSRRKRERQNRKKAHRKHH